MVTITWDGPRYRSNQAQDSLARPVWDPPGKSDYRIVASGVLVESGHLPITAFTVATPHRFKFQKRLTNGKHSFLL